MNSQTSHSLDSRLEQLYSRINYERQSRITPRSFKLVNMRELLRRLGDPHLKYPVIHVAGTKGKGSVSTLSGSILTASGKKTGVYTSPHLETIHQRMAIDGQLITDQQLLDVLNEIQPVLDQMDAEALSEDRRDLTFFEVTTAAMFYHFAKEKVDIAVVEVGLGGRLDSTNVCHPSVCVITNISHDHTKQLGDTLDAIAREKAGIIKSNIPVVSGAINPDASAVIQEVADQRNSALYVLDRDFQVNENLSPGSVNGFSTTGTLANGSYRIEDLDLNVLGKHQTINAGIAIAAVRLLAESNEEFEFSTEVIRSGLVQAQLVGRTEYIRSEPDVVVDMAHNVASIAALVDTITKRPKWKTAESRRLIMATSREKDAQGMICLLIRHFDEIIFTKYQNNPRGKSPDELVEIASRLRDQMNLATEISVADSPEAAWSHVETTTAKDDIVCITGSAFLVAELRKTVLDSRSS